MSDTHEDTPQSDAPAVEVDVTVPAPGQPDPEPAEGGETTPGEVEPASDD